jgi:beta-N-acetylhexosaminidase
MTPQEKVGQVFMVSLYGKDLTEAGATLLQTYHPGAVSLFAYNTDFQPAEEVARLINAMQHEATQHGAGIPLFIAIDHEGGRVQRLVNDVTLFPDPLAYGAVDDPALVQAVGAALADELAQLGINMNLAPVLDLFSERDMLDKNRVLHRRTLGQDSVRVGQAAAAFAAGQSQRGVVSVGKHFPGHGGTAVDSHHRLPVLEMDSATAYAEPLAAFQTAIATGHLPAIMLGHLYYSALEPQANLPASLSPTLVTLLRDEMDYDGLIMTDALDMAAIAGTYALPDAALLALNAGVDMVVLGPNVSWQTQEAAFEHILAALENGQLAPERLDEAVRRILTVKAEFGLLEWQPVEVDGVAQRINRDESRQALLALYEAAVTLVKDEEGLLPFGPDDTIAVAYPAIYEYLNTPCGQLAPPETKLYGYTFFPSDFDFNSVARLGLDYDKVVIFVEDAYKHLAHRDLVSLLPPEKTIVVALSSPLDLALFPQVSSYVVVYSNSEVSQEAACQAIFGPPPIQGSTPIQIGDYPPGTGILIRQ